MIGLAAHRRDASLVRAAGERAPPSCDELVAAVQRTLVLDGGPRPTGARWVYARWKPGRALACAWEVAFDDGSTRVVSSKSHVGDKRAAPPSYTGAGAALRPWGFDSELEVFLSVFPSDRELPGLARAFDLRRVARHLDASGHFAPLCVRPGPSRVEALRYKPGRRAVLRLELKLRESDHSPRVARSLIARVLPPESASACAQLRRRFDALAFYGLCPRLVAAEERTGVLYEEALDVRAAAPTQFEHARIAGERLAQLHVVPLDALAAPEPVAVGAQEWTALAPWLDAAGGEAPRARRRTWLHGDAHPDQFAVDPHGAWWLLDLDSLAVGDPCYDLASWIADALAARAHSSGALDSEDCAGELLAGYASAVGEAPRWSELAPWVAHALLQRAAAALRRLEEGALERSRLLADLARSVRGAGVATRENVVIERIDPLRDGEPNARVVTTLIETSARRAERQWHVERAGERLALAPAHDSALALGRALSSDALGTLEVLAYRPARRLTLRRRERDGRTSILKGYRRGRVAPAALRVRLAQSAGRAFVGVRTAELVALHADWNAVELEDLGGRPLDLRELAPARMELLGAALRGLQSHMPLEPLELHDDLAELAVLRAHLESARALSSAPEGAAVLVEQLERVRRQLPTGPIAVAHRDLHDGQLLELGDALGWIDFDLAACADVALDAANFCAHLTLRREQGLGPASEARERELRGALLCGLGRNDAPEFSARFEFYTAASYLRLALVYALRPPWRHLCAPLVRLARQAADRSIG